MSMEDEMISLRRDSPGIEQPHVRRVRPSLLVTVVLIITCSGCAVPGYFQNRKRDALDIVSITAGVGGGAAVRIGPVHAGLLYYEDRAGIRNGDVRQIRKWDSDARVWRGKDACAWQSWWVAPLLTIPTPEGFTSGVEGFRGDGTEPDRRKGYEAGGICPFIMLPTDYLRTRERTYPWTETVFYPWHYYTQVDVAIAVGYGVRIGVNPGELLDFLLGWAGLDIFGDDYGTISNAPKSIVH